MRANLGRFRVWVQVSNINSKIVGATILAFCFNRLRCGDIWGDWAIGSLAVTLYFMVAA